LLFTQQHLQSSLLRQTGADRRSGTIAEAASTGFAVFRLTRLVPASLFAQKNGGAAAPTGDARGGYKPIMVVTLAAGCRTAV
jgi:hypothetical protein